eukprot:3074981-Amphidinium_carterae.2
MTPSLRRTSTFIRSCNRALLINGCTLLALQHIFLIEIHAYGAGSTCGWPRTRAILSLITHELCRLSGSRHKSSATARGAAMGTRLQCRVPNAHVILAHEAGEY